MKTVSLGLVILGASISALGQDPACVQTPPATRLEAFLVRTGSVLIRGYSRMGRINGTGQVIVEAREFRQGGSPNAPRAAGISITVQDAGKPERESTSYIDAEEIDSLVQGLESIARLSKDATRLAFVEGSYRTKGDLNVAVFNDREGDTKAAVSSGRIEVVTAFIRLSDIEVLRQFILSAKSKI